MHLLLWRKLAWGLVAAMFGRAAGHAEPKCEACRCRLDLITEWQPLIQKICSDDGVRMSSGPRVLFKFIGQTTEDSSTLISEET